MRTIHIIRHTEIQYFNPPILFTHHTSTYLFKPYHLIIIHFILEHHNIQNDYFNQALAAGNFHIQQCFVLKTFRPFNAAYFSIYVPHFLTISVIRQIFTTILIFIQNTFQYNYWKYWYNRDPMTNLYIIKMQEALQERFRLPLQASIILVILLSIGGESSYESSKVICQW